MKIKELETYAGEFDARDAGGVECFKTRSVTAVERQRWQYWLWDDTLDCYFPTTKAKAVATVRGKTPDTREQRQDRLFFMGSRIHRG